MYGLRMLRGGQHDSVCELWARVDFADIVGEHVPARKAKRSDDRPDDESG